MCSICSTFNPVQTGCAYQGLSVSGMAPPVPMGQFGAVIKEDGDAGTTSATAGAIAEGEFFAGTLASNTDADWIEVDVVAGQAYTISAVGIGTLEAQANDIDLILRDATGAQIAYDDNSGSFFQPTLTFTADETVTYTIEVQSFPFAASTSAQGDYMVSFNGGNKSDFNKAMILGSLLSPGQAWTTTAAVGETEVTWAVRASGRDPLNYTDLEVLNANQIELVEIALGYLDAISGLNLTRVNPEGASNAATMLFGAYDADDNAGAYAFLPGFDGGVAASTSFEGDVWINLRSFGTGPYYFGTYQAAAMLHEIGHAIGLPHPGNYNAGATPITYAEHAHFVQDTRQYTVMSYFDGKHTGASAGLGYPDTFMLYDFMAIHALYGADTGHNAGDTTYGFNATNVLTPDDFTVNPDPYMTIYDGAGTDTIDLSGYTTAQWLRLEEGVFSHIGEFADLDGSGIPTGAMVSGQNNFSIAYGAVIEAAIGGSGDDTLMGNGADNRLDGGAGRDHLTGANGSDTILGGLGEDSLDGGDDHDVLDGGADNDDLTGGRGRDTVFGAAGQDSLSGGAGADLLRGGTGLDTVMGGVGQDTLFGDEGDDVIHGGESDDTLHGGAGMDLAMGEDGHDLLRGGEGADRLLGGTGSDTVKGDAGDDALEGGGGGDTLSGGEGADTLDGEGGDDRLQGDNGHDALQGGLGDDRLFGGAGFDTLDGGDGNDHLDGGKGADRLDGALGADTLLGGAGNDLLFGGDQHDSLDGGDHDDTIDGGTGFDTVIGGAGDDLLAGGGGADTVSGGQGRDQLSGGNGHDLLRGGADNDQLDGRQQDDTLDGGAGRDLLAGGLGDDLLTGSLDGDKFVFKDGHGADTITDFEATNVLEKINFADLSDLNSLSDVIGTGSGTAAAEQVGADVVITTASGTIVLQSVDYADLDSTDFIF